jgi:hypothetical protein
MARADPWMSAAPPGRRRLAGGLIALAMLAFGWNLMREPTWLVQRLESPTGVQTAFLRRVMYVNQYYEITLKRGFRRDRIYQSPPIEIDYRVDDRERLLWSTDGRFLYFSRRGRIDWGFDTAERRPLMPEDLAAAQERESTRLAR